MWTNNNRDDWRKVFSMPLTALRHLEQAKLMLDAYNEHLQADSLRSAAVYFMHSVRGLMKLHRMNLGRV
ncbi:hypothetical protein [Paenibacillus taichungensis]|nr:hypothetical protein [Paenibacillus taichungensis]